MENLPLVSGQQAKTHGMAGLTEAFLASWHVGAIAPCRQPHFAILTPRWAWLNLVLFCGLLYLPGLGDRDLTSSHEARAAQNAQMILDEGHWLVPRLFDRHLELQKPPLYYWLVASIA